MFSKKQIRTFMLIPLMVLLISSSNQDCGSFDYHLQNSNSRTIFYFVNAFLKNNDQNKPKDNTDKPIDYAINPTEEAYLKFFEDEFNSKNNSDSQAVQIQGSRGTKTRTFYKGLLLKNPPLKGGLSKILNEQWSYLKKHGFEVLILKSEATPGRPTLETFVDFARRTPFRIFALKEDVAEALYMHEYRHVQQNLEKQGISKLFLPTLTDHLKNVLNGKVDPVSYTHLTLPTKA